MREDINKLEQNMVKLQKDIEYIKESLLCNKEDHKEMMERIDKWIETSEKRFAPRWVADAMKFVMGAVSVIILGAILSLILI